MLENDHDEVSIPGVDRRDFLRGTALAAVPLVLGASGAVRAAGGEQKLPPLIVREKEPENLEFPFSALNQSIIPNDRFYVRNHFAVPKLDLKTWKLKVEGAVKK